MPWTRSGSGYTTKKRGGFVRNPDQYEALRRKGMSKERAAAITNSRRMSKGLSPGFDAAAAGAKWESKEAARIVRLKSRGARGFGQHGNAHRYFHPTLEAQAASHQRRKAQAIQRASKPYVRHPYQPPGWKDHVRRGPVISLAATSAVGTAAAAELHRSNLHKGAKGTLRRVLTENESQIRTAAHTSLVTVGGGAAIGVGVGLAHPRRKKIAKADSHQVRNTALGGVVGSSAATGANLVGGQAVKAALKINRAHVGVSQKDIDVWAAHKAKYGVRGKTHRSVPNKTLVAIHENYPKQLPGWRTQRVLGFKNRASTRAGVKVVGALTGAELVHHHYANKQKFAKAITQQQYARRKRTAAALGTTSAIIGLGTLAAKGGQGVLRRTGPKGLKAAAAIGRHTEAALVVGGGVGAAGALNSASINRIEAKQRIQQPKKVVISHAAPDHRKPKEVISHMAPLTAVPTQNKSYAAKVKAAAKAPVAPISTTKGVLNQVSQATSGQPMFPQKIGKGFARDLRTGIHEGYGLAGAPGATIRGTVKAKAARKGLKIGYTAGSHAQSFGAGFSRKQPTLEALQSGAHTTKANATHPNSYSAGNATRKVGVPVAITYGGYRAGKAYGQHRERKKITKAYTPGQIVYHTDQAALHSRKKTSGKRQLTTGIVTTGAGASVHMMSPHLGRMIGQRTARPAHEIGSLGHELEAAKHTRRAQKIVGRTGLGLVAGGAALAGVGAGRVIYHGHKQNKEIAMAQDARRRRSAHIQASYAKKPVVKAYGYDPEYNRHRRAGYYSGAANVAGGVAGGVAVHQGYKGVQEGRKAVSSFKSISAAKGPGSAGAMHAAQKVTVKTGTAAAKHGGKALGAAVAGGTLVAVGRKIKRKQTQGDWRSYRGY